jgi:uncharacterized glyoxalase superfamily protein PhnB
MDPARDGGWPAIYYFYPENVVDLHAEVKRKELQASDLRATFYGMKEFEVRDPDGHILWFGQETDEPPTPESQCS